MRHVRRRRRWAALMYMAFGSLAIVIAAASASIVLLVVGAISFAFALAALHRYPVELRW